MVRRLGEDGGEDQDRDSPAEGSPNANSEIAEIAIAQAAQPAQPPQPQVQEAELIYDKGGWDFCALASDAPVGRLHHLGATSLKATCKIHKSQVLHLCDFFAARGV